MSNKTWDDALAAFQTFAARVDAAPEIVLTGLKSFTWDVVTKGKSAEEAYNDIQAKAQELEARIQAHRKRLK